MPTTPTPVQPRTWKQRRANLRRRTLPFAFFWHAVEWTAYCLTKCAGIILGDEDGVGSPRPKTWSQRRTILFQHGRRYRFLLPFVAGECASGWIAYWLGRWSFVKILEYVGRFSVLVAVIVFFTETPKRREAKEDTKRFKHYQAWTVINSARGIRADGGRSEAIAELVRDGIALNAIDLSFARLVGLIATNANAPEADLHDANISLARLDRALLIRANLTRVNAEKVTLTGAELMEADLQDADLSEANLSDAFLNSANLRRARMRGAWVSRASFNRADLRYADLFGLRGYEQIQDLKGANIYGVTNAPPDFLAWATNNGACNAATDEEWSALYPKRP